MPMFGLCTRHNDNNAAEVRKTDDQNPAEDLRLPATLTGAEQFCAIRSYLANAAHEHDIGFFHALATLAEGHPWMPAIN